MMKRTRPSIILMFILEAWLLAGCSSSPAPAFEQEYRFRGTQAGSYGPKHDLKALAAVMKDDIGRVDCDSNQVLRDICHLNELSRVVITAVSFSEQGKYQEALKYWKLHFSQMADWGDVMNTKLFPSGSRINFACPSVPIKIWVRYERTGTQLYDSYDINSNWYYYQAKLHSGERDISPWLQRAYLCSTVMDVAPVRYTMERDRDAPFSEPSKSKKIDAVLWDGRQLRNGRFDDGSSLPKNYARDVVLKEYVTTMRLQLGDAEAATAQRFVDEILKPLWAAEDKLSRNFETGSIIQQQDKSRLAQRDAARAALYDKAVIATANRNFPSIYVEVMKGMTLLLMEKTINSIE